MRAPFQCRSMMRPAAILTIAACTAVTAWAQTAPASGAGPGVGAGDPIAGGQSFIQCADCHSTTASHGAGPGLRGVVGRPAAKAEGFKYSPALAKSGLVWDAKSLDVFLANPKGAVPGTSMDFPGVSDAAERANLIAYLATLK